MTNSCFVLGLSMATASLVPASAFTAPLSSRNSHRQYCGGDAQQQYLRMTASESTPADARAETTRANEPISRRQCLASAMSAAGLLTAATVAEARDPPKTPPRARLPDGDTQGSDYMELGGGSKSFAKPRIRYPDFETLESGLQYKDAKVGTGTSASKGDRVVMDWEGYTIGYNGNLFETSKGPKGGGFDKEQTSYRFVVGNGDVIPGLEEGIKGMKAGGVRQIVVPPEV
ncbi:unnamed protein product, partial [Laminaria digitata]